MVESNVTDFKDFKYTKIAKEFIALRKVDPGAAAKFAASSVDKTEYDILKGYIKEELARGQKIT